VTAETTPGAEDTGLIGTFGEGLPPCDASEWGAAASMLPDGRCRCIVCARCGHHTGNSHQGHYWGWCKVTRSMRTAHLCCPDPAFGCELEAARD